MDKYYVNNNAQSNGDHEVHKSSCSWLPKPENRTYIGEHYSCHSAVVVAKQYHDQVNGCKHCSEACHTG